MIARPKAATDLERALIDAAADVYVADAALTRALARYDQILAAVQEARP